MTKKHRSCFSLLLYFWFFFFLIMSETPLQHRRKPEADASKFVLEDGTVVSTRDRVCKSKIERFFFFFFWSFKHQCNLNL